MRDIATEGCKIAEGQVTMATKFCAVAPNTFASSEWNLLPVGVRAPRILRRRLDYWKIFELLS